MFFVERWVTSTYFLSTIVFYCLINGWTVLRQELFKILPRAHDPNEIFDETIYNE